MIYTLPIMRANNDDDGDRLESLNLNFFIYVVTPELFCPKSYEIKKEI